MVWARSERGRQMYRDFKPLSQRGVEAGAVGMTRGLRVDEERPGRGWEGFGRGCRPESVGDGVLGVRGSV